MADARLALRRLRDEPVREAIAAIFATRAVQEAFLPEPASDADTQHGADAARAGLSGAIDRLVAVTGCGGDTVSIAFDLSQRIGRARAVRPRLLAQAVAGWAIFDAVAQLACEADVTKTVLAFDEWDAAAAVSDLARRAGSADAQAWRVVELTRALLTLAPGVLAEMAAGDGLPGAWFASPAVRLASGWNEWQGATYLRQEAWDELIDALAARDLLLDLDGAEVAATELKRRAAAAGYRLDGEGREADPVQPEA